MQTTVTNLAARFRDGWFQVTYPANKVRDFGVECRLVTNDGRSWRAVRGATIGKKTIYRVFAWGIGAKETVVGKLLNEPHEFASAPFTLHPWVYDDIAALIPFAGVHDGTTEKWAVLDAGPTLIGHSPVHQRWWLKQRIPEWGIVFEWWADLLAGDPVVPCWGKIVWSDRNDPNPTRRFQNFAIRSGESFALDFAKRCGAVPPVRDAQGRWVTILNSTAFTLGDGTGLPISGVLLGMPKPGTETKPPANPEDLTDPTVRSFNMLVAALEGPIVAVSHDWNGDWCGNKNTPRLSVALGTQEWESFENSALTTVGWFAPRPVGIGLTPGQTGDQEDFGACKGTYAVTEHDPRHLRRYQYSVYSELFRGINLYEASGAPLSAADHPNWVTWNGVTHYHPGVSPDRLGKNDAWSTTPPGTGWYGYDDQHRSQNNLAAYAMLTDDPLANDQIKQQFTVDAASYRSRYPQYGMGAARAQGRVAQAIANFLTVTSDAQRTNWEVLLRARMAASDQLPTMNVSGPMKVLAWGGPDGRKQIYYNGQLASWTSMWEHGLAAVGIYAAAKQLPSDTQTQNVLRKVCSTLLQFGFFKQGGQWYTVDDILYLDGAAPPGGMTLAERQLTATPGAGGTGTWTFAGILVAREVLGTTPELDDYVATITNGTEAQDRRSAEWWAAVTAI